MTQRVIYVHYEREPSVGTCAVDCGAKCCRTPGHVLMNEREMTLLRALDRKGRVRFSRTERPGVWAMEFRDLDCVFLHQSSNLCTIYDRRPRGCREFPVRPYAECLVWPKREENASS